MAKVEDVLHEEGPPDNTLWAWWPDRHKAVVVDVVVKQWREADVHAGSGPHEEDNLHGGETVGATPSSSVNNLRRGCFLALQIFRKTPEAAPVVAQCEECAEGADPGPQDLGGHRQGDAGAHCTLSVGAALGGSRLCGARRRVRARRGSIERTRNIPALLNAVR